MPDIPEDAVDVTVLIIGHREATLLVQAVRSARLAIEIAAERGVKSELLVVLDRADTDTETVARSLLGKNDRLLASSFGDPSQARNLGVSVASGRSLALLDGDDMFGSAWILQCHIALQERGFGKVCLHPEITLIFGEEMSVWIHVGMTHPDFRVRHLLFENYYTSLCFAPLHVFRETQFRPVDLSHGFGHEDWAWVADTIYHGVDHVVIPETLHAVRRKRSSRLLDTRGLHAITLPTPLFSGREVRPFPSTA